jgi:hypothetical protein
MNSYIELDLLYLHFYLLPFNFYPLKLHCVVQHSALWATFILSYVCA